MARFLFGVLAVFAGCLAAMAAMVTIETMGHVLFPPPPGIDLTRPGSMVEVMKAMPAAAFLPVLIGWGMGTLIGSSVAAKLAPGWKLGNGLIVGGLLLAASVANMLMLPHPIWVWVVGLAVFPAAALVGGMLGSAGSLEGPAAPRAG